ncbi:MAG: YggS family pyridoxal phosphate enzyme [Rhodobacteraceae bacterium TMED111]|nr:YggS family pyridoxal phosphate-dependent enzyme [Marinovum sp.]OUV39956.1 MAG: YggS family pyridoxal phosphate enzyme [Rhodobacteraceae bacterium TMED111]
MSLKEIYSKVEKAEQVFSRPVGNTKVIAVSKVQPLERIISVLDQGHRIFGENRIQEAHSKWPELKEKYGEVELHIIGPLQTNKTRLAMELSNTIHTLDRQKLAKNIARLAQEMGKCPDLFVQVNTGEEKQKSGISPSETGSFVKECLSMDLPVKGLMCIPPFSEEASLHFALLKSISENCGLQYLSMGMSADFEKAISFGATHVRVGSAIFGDRVRLSEQ